MILLDSPPVNTVMDSVILSWVVNGVIMVIRAGSPKRELVKRTQQQLQQTETEILGGVLNYVDIRKNKYYYYYAYHYPHYYQGEDDMVEFGQFSDFGIRKLLGKRN